jgi:hypothetical protein
MQISQVCGCRSFRPDLADVLCRMNSCSCVSKDIEYNRLLVHPVSSALARSDRSLRSPS